MILRLIEVENFLSHQYEKISFEKEGIYLIEGESGSGKSSFIADAVGFALFGFTATRARTIKELRNDDVEGKDFKVRIAFELPSGDTFEITRGADEKGKSFANLVDSNGGYAEADKEVRVHLRKLIGTMDAKTYYRSFASRQDELASLTDMQTEDRRKFVNKMLGIDVLDEVTKDLKKQSRRIGTELQKAETELGIASPALLEQKKQVAVENISELEEAIAEIRKLAQEKEQEAEELLLQLAPLQQAITERQKKRTRLGELTGILPAAKKEHERLVQLQAEQEKHEKTAATEEQLFANGKALSEEREVLRTLQEEYKAMEREKAEQERIQKELALLPEVSLKAKPPVEKLSAQLATLRAELAASEEKLRELQASQSQLLDQGVCTLCLRPMDEHEKDELEHKWETQEKNLQTVIKTNSERIARGEQILETAKARAAEQEALQSQLARRQVLVEQSEILQTQLASYKLNDFEPARLAEVENSIERTKDGIREARRAKAWLAQNEDLGEEIARREGEIWQYTRELEAIQADIEAGQNEEDELLAKQEQEREARRANSSCLVRAGEKENELHVARRALELAEEELSRYGDVLKQLEGLRKKGQNLSDLIEHTLEFKKQLAAQIRPQLEAIASDIMNKLSHGRYPRMEISEDYEITLIRNTGIERESRMLSGGEKVRANFSLRLALMRLITNRTGTPIQYIILDEVFGAQDPEHRERMLDVLSSIKPFYPQIFLISHVENLSDNELVNFLMKVPAVAKKNRITIESI